MSEERTYRTMPVVSHAEFETMCREGCDELHRAIISLALVDEDLAFVERACVLLSSHGDEFVRGNAILGFGHLARRFGELSTDCQPIIEKGLLDKSVHVRGQAEAASQDVEFFLGWLIEGFDPGPGLEGLPDDTTELSEYLAAATSKEWPDVDWTAAPWAAAHRALFWLRLAPERPDHRQSGCLSPAETMLLCRRMVAKFVNPDGRLAWSSYMLSTAVEAIAVAAGGPPEPLLRASWELLEDRSLDRLVYDFCHAIGIEVLARSRAKPGWDLRWMLESKQPSQVCLRYWTMALRPALWDDELERETQETFKSAGLDER